MIAARYGCFDKSREPKGYWAQNGYTDVPQNWGNVERYPVWVWVKPVMSTDCRYDRAGTDSRCAGCVNFTDKPQE